MGGLLKDHLLATLDPPKKGLLEGRGGLIEAPGRHQGRDLDLAEAILRGPVLDRTDDVELGRSIHRVVDGGINVDLRESLAYALRPGVEPAKISEIENLAGGSVLGIVGRVRP